MKVTVYPGTFDLKKPLEDFTVLKVQNDPRKPMMYFTLEGLKPNAYYQVEVIASNDIGDSLARPYIFRTKDGKYPCISTLSMGILPLFGGFLPLFGGFLTRMLCCGITDDFVGLVPTLRSQYLTFALM